MKQDVLICPFCGRHSYSRLTTNISDESVVRCNYCDNQFKMEQARVQTPQINKRRTLRSLRSQPKKRWLSGSSQRANPEVEADAPEADRNELAIAAFITSLVAFLSAGCLSPIALVFALIALEGKPRGLAAAAVVLSLVGLVPLTTVALPVIAKPLLEMANTQVTLSDSESAEEPASERKSAAVVSQSSRAVPSEPIAASRQGAKDRRARPAQSRPAAEPVLRFSDIKQDQKPLGGLGLYLTAENVSDKPVLRFEALVQFIDKNDEVVAQDKIRESFRKPLAPGEKRTLVFTPGYRSELRGVVPDTCRGTATVTRVN